MLCLCYQMRITKEYIIYLGNNKIFILLPSTSIITWFSKCEVCWKLFQSNFSWGEVRRLCKEMRNGFWQIWFFTYKISLSFCLLSYVNSVRFTWWRDYIRLSYGSLGLYSIICVYQSFNESTGNFLPTNHMALNVWHTHPKQSKCRRPSVHFVCCGSWKEQ